ncbi:hypothetical protein DUI87_33550 [Hirundo rustica rustica]|uniref:Uncharacterized protein n=1 Tax=Hirundo rustica rustica TaxID=333673 RepID=A0A3M0IU46_HIRRU|nr:hypothetical protein DUI87_33550 [Hirundo rustica rustica]
MLKLTPLSLTPWLIVLKISFSIILLGKTLTPIARNYLEAEREQDVSPCPHSPVSQHPKCPIPKAPCPT